MKMPVLSIEKNRHIPSLDVPPLHQLPEELPRALSVQVMVVEETSALGSGAALGLGG